MASLDTLSLNAITTICTSHSSHDSSTPFNPNAIVQIIALNQGNNNRYKIEISDGVHSVMAMLSSQHAPMVADGTIALHTLIKLIDVHVMDNASQLAVVIIKAEPVQQFDAKIGNPTPYSATSSPIVPISTVQSHPAKLPTMEQFRPQSQSDISEAQDQHPVPVAASKPKSEPFESKKDSDFRIGSTSLSNNAKDKNVFPIRALTTYTERFLIKVRVTAKSDIKTWNKGGNNSGKLFSADLMDGEGEEIRATFFRDAVDKYYDIIEVGGVYYMSNGRVKMANRKFSAIKNDYEINFGGDVEVTKAQDDSIVAKLVLKPVHIANIERVSPDSVIDVLGLCMTVSNVQEFQSKTGRTFRKAEIELLDDSNAQIKVSIWGEKADEFVPKLQQTPHQVIGLKGVKVSDFNGRSLSGLTSSVIMIEPELPETSRLHSWYKSGGASSTQTRSMTQEATSGRGTRSIENRKTFASIRDNNIGSGSPNGEFIEVKGMIQFVKKDQMWYPACPEEGINKKVVLNTVDNKWYCEATSKSYDAPEYRYIATISAIDYSGVGWMSMFNEIGIKILGCTANELQAAKESNDPMFDKVINNTMFKTGVFTIKVKEESFQDGVRQRSTIIAFKPIDYIEESTQLIKAIKSYATR